jgi:hypothetical protein
VFLFCRLEAEAEDQCIDSLEKELGEVSWNNYNINIVYVSAQNCIVYILLYEVLGLRSLQTTE